MGKRRPERVFGYARVSSVAQVDGTSLDDQQRAMTAHAATLGVKVTRFFVESESGIHEKIERREQMRALLAAVKSGDLILCDKIDRWSRDPEFTYKSVREILAAGASFYAVGDALDPSTNEGDTALGFRVLFAREEHKRIKQRLVGTRKLLRDRGLYVEGLPPWGYRRQSEKKGADRGERNVLVVEQAEADAVRSAFKLCIQGKAINEIASALDVSRDVIADALHRRLYTGEIQDAEGAWIRGKHPAIVDARAYQAAQEALRGRLNGSRPPKDGGGTADWWLRDVARCGRCGAKMTSAYAGPKVRRRFYFMCTRKCEKPSRFVLVSWAEEACETMMRDRLQDLRDELARPPAPVKARPAVDLRERRGKLEAKRARYQEMRADGDMTRAELQLKLAKLDVERLQLDALEITPPVQSPEDRRAELSLAATAARWWMRLPPRDRRQVVNRLAISIGLAINDDEQLIPKPVWRNASEVDLSEVGDLLAKYAPTRAEQAASDAAARKFAAKLRAN